MCGEGLITNWQQQQMNMDQVGYRSITSIQSILAIFLNCMTPEDGTTFL
jgi:hypothetical protein